MTAQRPNSPFPLDLTGTCPWACILHDVTEKQTESFIVVGGRRSFTPLNCGWEEEVIYSIKLWVRWEEEVIHSIELWVGGGGYSLHGVVGGRRRLFTPLCCW